MGPKTSALTTCICLVLSARLVDGEQLYGTDTVLYGTDTVLYKVECIVRYGTLNGHGFPT